MIIHLVAEGEMEVAVATRLIDFCGHKLGSAYGRRGCGYVRKNAAKYSHLAKRGQGVLVLTDFRDTGAVCAADALQDYILNKMPKPPKSFLCRFAVNELESWLLADRQGMASFLGIATSKMPQWPEKEARPKKTMMALARGSKKKWVREEIAPPLGHRALVGPGYTAHMRDYIVNFWDIEASMQFAPSLRRCVERLQGLS
jgi:hypothetical protein